MKPDAFHYHEIADRCHVVQHMLEDHICDHPAMQAEQREKIEKAQTLISEVYQWAALQSFAASEPKKDDPKCSCDEHGACSNCWDRPMQSAPNADAEGWIEWHGGECPVHPRAEVEAKLRDGTVFKLLARDWVWRHYTNEVDIVAYRVVK